MIFEGKCLHTVEELQQKRENFYSIPGVYSDGQGKHKVLLDTLESREKLYKYKPHPILLLGDSLYRKDPYKDPQLVLTLAEVGETTCKCILGPGNEEKEKYLYHKELVTRLNGWLSVEENEDEEKSIIFKPDETKYFIHSLAFQVKEDLQDWLEEDSICLV